MQIRRRRFSIPVHSPVPAILIIVGAILAAIALVLSLGSCSSHATPNTTWVAANQASASAQPAQKQTTEAQPSGKPSPSQATTEPTERQKVLKYLMDENRTQNIQAKVQAIGYKLAQGIEAKKFGPVLETDLPSLGDHGWVWIQTTDGKFSVLIMFENGTLRTDQIRGIVFRNKKLDYTTEVTFLPPNGLTTASNNPNNYWLLTSAADDHVMSTDMTNLDHPEMSEKFAPTTLADMETLNEKVIKTAIDDVRSWFPDWQDV